MKTDEWVMKQLTREKQQPWVYLTDPTHGLRVQQAAALRKASKMLAYIKKEVDLQQSQ